MGVGEERKKKREMRIRRVRGGEMMGREEEMMGKGGKRTGERGEGGREDWREGG